MIAFPGGALESIACRTSAGSPTAFAGKSCSDSKVWVESAATLSASSHLPMRSAPCTGPLPLLVRMGSELTSIGPSGSMRIPEVLLSTRGRSTRGLTAVRYVLSPAGIAVTCP